MIDTEGIEDAILQTLKEGRPDPQDPDNPIPGMSYVKHWDSYQGQLDEIMIASFAMNFPAVLIYMEDSKYTNRSFPKMWAHLDFNILVCAQNLRGNKAARRGDINTPGVYQMLRDVFRLLHGYDLGLAAEEMPLVAVSESAIINTAKRAVYSARYITQAAKN